MPVKEFEITEDAIALIMTRGGIAAIDFIPPIS